MTAEATDLLVIGGGAMGLFTAYHASARAARVLVLEQGHVGDPMTASYGRTRSFRSDDLDATYARLAREALRLWGEFEQQTGAKVQGDTKADTGGNVYLSSPQHDTIYRASGLSAEVFAGAEVGRGA